MNNRKVFAIRNKANNRDANNFQKRHTHGNYSAQLCQYIKIKSISLEKKLIHTIFESKFIFIFQLLFYT